MEISNLDVYLILKQSGMFVPVGYFEEKRGTDFYIWNNIAIRYCNNNGGFVEISGKIPLELEGEFSYLTIYECSDKDAWIVKEDNVLGTGISDEFLKDSDQDEKYICYCRVNSREDLMKFVLKLKYCYEGGIHFFKSVDDRIDLMLQMLREDKIKLIYEKCLDNKKFEESCQKVKNCLDDEEGFTIELGDIERVTLIQQIRNLLNDLVEMMMAPIYMGDDQGIRSLVANTNVDANIEEADRVIDMSTNEGERWYCKSNNVVTIIGLEGKDSLGRAEVVLGSKLNVVFYDSNNNGIPFHFRPDLLKLHSNDGLSFVMAKLNEACSLAKRVITDNMDGKVIGDKRLKTRNMFGDKRTSDDNK